MQSRQYEPKKTKKSRAEIEEAYPLIDEKLGKRYKLGKRLVDQLEDPINLASPTQLCIRNPGPQSGVGAIFCILAFCLLL